MNSLDKILSANISGKFVCVGLDPDFDKLPSNLKSLENPVLEFNRLIIEATKQYAAAYKLNFAFYEKFGKKGFELIKKTLEFIPNDILKIADGKRGDIGNTAKMYAESVYGYFNFDACTLNPYMGKDSITPFLKYKNKLNFILGLTSNPSSSDFEKLKLQDGSMLYEAVIKKILEWNEDKNCGLVFGATNKTDMQEHIHLISKLPLLVPGIGAQGGNFDDVLKILLKSKSSGILINIGRSIIYKSTEKDFAEQSEKQLVCYNSSAEHILNHLPFTIY